MVVGQAVVRQLASPTGPRAAGRRTRPIDRLPSVGHRAHGMGKLQPAAGLWPVAVDAALTPLGSIAHRTHRLGHLSPTPVGCDQGQRPHGSRRSQHFDAHPGAG